MKYCSVRYVAARILRIQGAIMIRHIVLFKFKPGRTWRDSDVQEAERIAQEVGRRVPELKHWYVGRNVSNRPAAHDFVAVGLLPDADALQRYLGHPFHQEAIARWRLISDWVIADVVEEEATIYARELGGRDDALLRRG